MLAAGKRTEQQNAIYKDLNAFMSVYPEVKSSLKIVLEQLVRERPADPLGFMAIRLRSCLFFLRPRPQRRDVPANLFYCSTAATSQSFSLHFIEPSDHCSRSDAELSAAECHPATLKPEALTPRGSVHTYVCIDSQLTRCLGVGAERSTKT